MKQLESVERLNLKNPTMWQKPMLPQQVQFFASSAVCFTDVQSSPFFNKTISKNLTIKEKALSFEKASNRATNSDLAWWGR